MIKIPLIAVIGPTASGKTSLGVGLARALDGEVVSADSMQIYKGMPIAAAVPTSDEMCGVRHHLIECIDIGTEFSVADYVNLARKTISEINSRNKLPILVGGTGLYVNSIIDNIEFVEQKTDPILRSRLENEFDRCGADKMLDRLSSFDPDSAARLNPCDRRRIIRAFEIYYVSGLTATEAVSRSKRQPSPYDAVMIGVTFRSRAVLYERINSRVDKMLENGLLCEAEKYCCGKMSGAFQAIGHKEFAGYFAGNESLENAVETLKRETRHYAKRQLTWFGRDERIKWIYADETDDVLKSALKIYKEVRNGTA